MAGKVRSILLIVWPAFAVEILGYKLRSMGETGIQGLHKALMLALGPGVLLAIGVEYEDPRRVCRRCGHRHHQPQQKQ